MTIIPKLLLTLSCLFFISCSTAREFTAANTVLPSPTTDLVNINTATTDELAKLPGIGETLAQKIIDFRETNGRFRRSEHLMLIDGISEKRYREIKPFISLE